MKVKGKVCFVLLVFIVSATVSFAGQHGIIYAEKEQAVRKMVADCHQSCQGSEGEQHHPQCFQTCMQKGFREHGKSQGGDSHRPEIARKTESNNPYVFDDSHFTTRLETEHGKVMFLQKFTKRSELFRGIEKYRPAVLEAKPQTFIQPNYWDADALFFVANGKGTIALIEGNSRKSHNIKQGDLFLLRAGITAYLINTDDNERLVLAKILHSVSVPGELQFFNGVGGFFNAFSHQVLEAAFGDGRQSIQRMFGQRKAEQGLFKKATPEQIKSFAGEDRDLPWPFGDRKEKDRHVSIYKDEPSIANENGILHEVNSKDLPGLRDINVAFSFFNITQGSMAGPFYNAKATLVLMVANGVGRFEMVCPHLSEQASDGEISPHFEKVSSELTRGMTVVVPVGHPLAIEALGDQNLEVVAFGLNSDKNVWFPLAGRENVMSQWEDAALELTFGFPAKEVRTVIEMQHKKLFFKAPVSGDRAFA